MKKLMEDILGLCKSATENFRLAGRILVCLLPILFCGCFVLNAEEDSSLIRESDSLIKVLSSTKNQMRKYLYYVH